MTAGFEERLVIAASIKGEPSNSPVYLLANILSRKPFLINILRSPSKGKTAHPSLFQFTNGRFSLFNNKEFALHSVAYPMQFENSLIP